jgi:hypothetical protein
MKIEPMLLDKEVRISQLFKKELLMENNHQTYTYTARSVENPDQVVTFTLYDGHMRVNLTGYMDQASAVGHAEEKRIEIREQISAQAKPIVMKVVEEMTEPVHVNDVQARLLDDRLRITLWQRLAGLRLAPVMFNMGQIDNEEAAEAFVNELEQRQEEESYVGKFFGPLDYWIGWLGMIVVIGILLRWPGRKEN